MTLGVMPLRPPRSLEDLAGEATSAMPESILLAAYGGVKRVERCQCGGIVAAIDSDRSIARAVEEHNATPVHRAWRLEVEG